MLAEPVFGFNLVAASGACSMLHFPVRVVYERGCDDARGDGDDGVAQQHDEGREQSAEGCHGCDVAIAHGGHGDDGVVDGCSKVGELGVGLVAFDEIHERADARHEDKHEHEVHHDFAHTASQGLQQQIALVEKAEELEHPEDADEAERAQEHHVARAGEDDAEIGWDGRDEVDDAEETKCIVSRPWRTIEPGAVVDGEKQGHECLQHFQNMLVGEGQRLDALYECHDDAEQDDGDEGHVVGLAFGGVGLEDNLVEPLFFHPYWFVHIAKIVNFRKPRM